MRQVDPHQPPRDERLIDAQRACGRWFALRRLDLRLTSKQLAGIAGVPIEHIQLLESGLADDDFVPETARQNLSRMMATRGDHDWVADVIAIALGRPAALSPTTLDRVIDQLHDTDTQTPPRERPASAPAAAPAEAARPDSDILDQPGLYEVLSVLAEAENYTYAIWAEVRRRYRRIGVAEVSELLGRLQDYGLIEEAAEPLRDEALDSEPLQIYRITAGGRVGFHAARTRRAVEAERAQREQQEKSATRNPDARPPDPAIKT